MPHSSASVPCRLEANTRGIRFPKALAYGTNKPGRRNSYPDVPCVTLEWPAALKEAMLKQPKRFHEVRSKGV